MSRPTFASIDSAALKHNLAVVRRHAPRSEVMAVIKANAYGHGLLRAAAALSAADGYALLELEEAVRLREAGVRSRIVLLEGFFEPGELAVLVEHRLAPVVHCLDQVAALEALPASAKLDVLLKVNTGMNRLGLAPGDYAGVLERLRRNPGVGAITLMTHFADADGERGVAWQMERLRQLPGWGAMPLSLANSAAILRHPETHAGWVRPGIMLYGCSPFPGETGEASGLKPAMTLESRLIAVQDLRPGDTVGYGGMFRAERPMRIGVVACGYADGYPRHAPNGTPVRVADRMTGTVGRVSMDLLCVDLTDVAEARPGSRVVLWGEGVPAERVAEAAGTVSYQLLCALAPRVPVRERAQ
ncbi:MAG: alanine racemase [Betaproteobacteria bacterium]|nr:alanine racemase [Betaproteobacteria bacterium]